MGGLAGLHLYYRGALHYLPTRGWFGRRINDGRKDKDAALRLRSVTPSSLFLFLPPATYLPFLSPLPTPMPHTSPLLALNPLARTRGRRFDARLHPHRSAWRDNKRYACTSRAAPRRRSACHYTIAIWSRAPTLSSSLFHQQRAFRLFTPCCLTPLRAFTPPTARPPRHHTPLARAHAASTPRAPHYRPYSGISPLFPYRDPRRRMGIRT